MPKYIEEGDIYQANISDKLVIKNKKLDYESILEIYEKLKDLNPSPYMALIDFENYSIISSSPESFLKINYSK